MEFNDHTTCYNWVYNSILQIFRRIWEYKLSPNVISLLGILYGKGNLRQRKEIHSLNNQFLLEILLLVYTGIWVFRFRINSL